MRSGRILPGSDGARDAQVEAQMLAMHLIGREGHRWTFDASDAADLKRVTLELVHSMHQMSGGVQGVPGDVPFAALPRLLGMLGCLCACLVLSGKLDEMRFDAAQGD